MIDRRRFSAGLAMGAAALVLAPRAMAQTAPFRATLVAEAAGRPIFREGATDLRLPPFSTFKTPLALMGFDAGVLRSATEPRIAYRAAFDASRREHMTTDPTVWQAQSILWYSQMITRELGMARFQAYVDGFGYGNRDLAGTPGRPGLSRSWLMSSLKISADEQVAFLRRMLAGDLPVSQEAVRQTRAITTAFDAPGGWRVRGKTGSGFLPTAEGRIDRARPQGWFAGWADRDGRRVLFARLQVFDGPRDRPASFIVRDELIAGLAGMAG